MEKVGRMAMHDNVRSQVEVLIRGETGSSLTSSLNDG